MSVIHGGKSNELKLMSEEAKKSNSEITVSGVENHASKTLIVRTDNSEYEVDISFRFTRVIGESGVGKTMLVDDIKRWLQGEPDISVESPLPIKVVDPLDDNITNTIANSSDTLFIMDEHCSQVHRKGFADSIKESSNCLFLVINRTKLDTVPHDFRSVCNMVKIDNKRRKTVPLLNDRIYYTKDVFVTNVKAEDSKSGYQFFKHIMDVPTDTLDGNGNARYASDGSLCICDGAGFGSQIKFCLDMFISSMLYLPNSFEYLVLVSNILELGSYKYVLNDDSEHLYSKYLSYERMCTAVLTELTKGTDMSYKKSVLNTKYLEPDIVKKIVSQFPEEVRKYVKDCFL